MNRAFAKYLILFLFIIIISSCGKNPTSLKYEKEIVVYGYLWGGKNLTRDRSILVNYTQPVDENYRFEKARIPGAIVKIRDDSTGKVWRLKENEFLPGAYFNEKFYVEFGRSYTLQIIAGDKSVEATTIVPEKITVETSLSTEEVNRVYPQDIGMAAPIKVICNNPDQIIMIDVFCQEPLENARYRSSFGGQEKPQTESEYSGGKNGAPRHLQAILRYDDLKSQFYGGEHVIYWYNAMIIFWGRNTLQILAIDENYHSYLSHQHAELFGGVVGGIGLFGSVSGVEFELELLEP